MRNDSILLGRAFGIPIRAHIMLLILLPILATLYSSSFILGLLFVIGVFTSVVLHELGHSLVAIRKGCHVHEIVLSPLGGVAKMSNIPARPMDEFQVAIAGPLVSLALAVILLPIPGPVLPYIGYINAILFVFNLIPAFPMDGGRILRAFLTTKKGRLQATKTAVTLGKVLCALFILVGLFGLKVRLFGFIGPLSRNPILALIGIYMLRAGQAEYRMVQMEYQANRRNGFQNGEIEVEVSPPPYAQNENPLQSWTEKISRLFKNR